MMMHYSQSTCMAVAVVYLVLLLSLSAQGQKIAVRSSGIQPPTPRFGSSLAPESMSSLSQRQNDKDTVPLVHRGNYFWQVYMHLGHQRMLVDIDTGSPTLVVQRASYDPKKPGSTATNLHREIDLSYGYGNDIFDIKTHLYEDQVSLGPLAGRVGVQRLIGKHDDFISLNDGLLGLARRGFNATTGIGFLETLHKTSKWDGYLTMDLRPKGGSMGFEAPKAGRDYRGDLVWQPSLSDARWVIRGQLGDIAFTARPDTGTFGIAAPLSAFRAIVAKYPKHLKVVRDPATGTHYMIGKCGWKPDLPFRFNGPDGKTLEFTLSSKAFFVYGKAYDMPGCTGSITGDEGVADDHDWLLGNPLFTSTVLVFDEHRGRVGIARKPIEVASL